MNAFLTEGCPELVKEWSDNNEYPPEKYTTGSNKKVLWVGACGHEWSASIKNRVYHNSGCPYCSGKKLLKGFNDLAYKKPELTSEWSDKNYPLKPDMVMCQSNKAVWWRRSCGHEWKARIADRYEGHGCPYCAGKILAGFNDLPSTRPAIMDEWSEKNTTEPTSVSELSREVVWWKCRDCGYEWRARIYTRCNGGGECPVCRHEISEQNYLAMLDDRVKQRAIKRTFAKRTVSSYLRLHKINYINDHETDIGLSISIYLPDHKIAIDFSTKKDNRIRENVKNISCRKRGITMIRILEPGVIKYDNCFCLKRKNESKDSIIPIIEKLHYIIGKKVQT